MVGVQEVNSPGRTYKSRLFNADVVFVCSLTSDSLRSLHVWLALQVIAALDSWARPIKEAALRAAEADTAPTSNGQVRQQQ